MARGSWYEWGAVRRRARRCSPRCRGGSGVAAGFDAACPTGPLAIASSGSRFLPPAALLQISQPS